MDFESLSFLLCVFLLAFCAFIDFGLLQVAHWARCRPNWRAGSGSCATCWPGGGGGGCCSCCTGARLSCAGCMWPAGRWNSAPNSPGYPWICGGTGEQVSRSAGVNHGRRKWDGARRSADGKRQSAIGATRPAALQIRLHKLAECLLARTSLIRRGLFARPTRRAGAWPAPIRPITHYISRRAYLWTGGRFMICICVCAALIGRRRNVAKQTRKLLLSGRPIKRAAYLGEMRRCGFGRV